jgi:hypothetical protein
MQLYKASWLDALVGFGKKLFWSSYVTFMQNKKPKKKDKAQVASVGKDWDPALQRKSKGSGQYKEQLSPVSEFLSNNLNWAFAVIAIIELLIYEFIFRHMFLFASEKLSAIAMKIPVTLDAASANSKQALTGAYVNNMQGLFDSLSKAASYIGHHIPILVIILCFIIYLCLLGFYSLQSKIRISFGSRFFDSLKNTNKNFLKIASLPFIAFEKILLFPIIVPLTFARLIFKKLTPAVRNIAERAS